MSKEHKLQAQMVMDFSAYRPEERKLLWSTRNITLSKQDGGRQKALGMVSGVADLIYFKNMALTGIEVKYPGERHKRTQIQAQYDWGYSIASEGGFYFIATSLDGFWAVINSQDHKNVYRLDQIKEKLDQGTATITF